MLISTFSLMSQCICDRNILPDVLEINTTTEKLGSAHVLGFAHSLSIVETSSRPKVLSLHRKFCDCFFSLEYDEQVVKFSWVDKIEFLERTITYWVQQNFQHQKLTEINIIHRKQVIRFPQHSEYLCSLKMSNKVYVQDPHYLEKFRASQKTRRQNWGHLCRWSCNLDWEKIQENGIGNLLSLKGSRSVWIMFGGLEICEPQENSQKNGRHSFQSSSCFNSTLLLRWSWSTQRRFQKQISECSGLYFGKSRYVFSFAN